MESLRQFFDHLPFLVKWFLWFWFNIIIIRGILANQIISELRERGLLKVNLVHLTFDFMDRFYVTARKSAIFHHYQLGHKMTLNECKEGRCNILLEREVVVK